jgi:hypothetical protein
MSSNYVVYIVDEDYETREWVEDYTDPREAEKHAETLREQLEEEGDSESLRVEVVEHHV